MNKNHFLTDICVMSFIEWMGHQITGDGKELHSWKSRSNKAANSRGVTVHFFSLNDALTKYRWPAKNPFTCQRIFSFNENIQCLKELGSHLRDAIEQGNDAKCIDYCKKTFEWGGVSRYISNLAPSIKRASKNGCLAEYLKSVQYYLTNLNDFETPFKFDKKGEAYQLDVDSGTTKIYSLMSNKWSIYDGRVGSALGFLVGKWANECNRDSVPEHLQFAHAREKHRNPNKVGEVVFPILTNNSSRLKHNLYANWLIHDVVSKHKNMGINMNLDEDLHAHALEASLFMIGYCIRNE